MSKRKNLKFRKMRGGSQPDAIQYTTETIIRDINKLNENNYYFANFGSGNERPMEHILKGSRDIENYKKNLCVFVDFKPNENKAVRRMYLGELTSTQKQLTNYGDTEAHLTFKCYKLYSNDTHDTLPEFTRSFRFNGNPPSGVLIGFLPSTYKDAVLQQLTTLEELK